MDLPNILLCCVARDNREQISARIIYERAHGQRKQENKGKDGKPLSDVHDEAPSQVPAYPFQKVERGSGERGSAADHQRPDWGMRHVPIGRRVHQADAEVSGDEGMEVRVGLCPTHYGTS